MQFLLGSPEGASPASPAPFFERLKAKVLLWDLSSTSSKI
jgi:hypothetical protein